MRAACASPGSAAARASGGNGAALGFVPLDGGLATACEDLGQDLSDDLWSARLLRDAPDVLHDVHCNFIKAGARIVVSSSYQACEALLAPKAGSDQSAAGQLMQDSVTIARAAADSSPVPVIVAGSVGSYGACLGGGQEYSGHYIRDEEDTNEIYSSQSPLPQQVSRAYLQAWHVPRLRALMLGGCDLLACETLPCIGEIGAIGAALDSISEGMQMPLWVSMTLQDSSTCASGEPLADAVTAAIAAFGRRLVAVGVNCCSPHHVLGAINVIKDTLASHELPVEVASYPSCEAAFKGFSTDTAAVKAGTHSADAPHRVHLLAYPNAGEEWNAATHSWETVSHGPCRTPDSAQWAALQGTWLQAGTTLVGGCCRCGPDYISALSTLEHTCINE